MPDSFNTRLPEPLSRCPFCATAYTEAVVRIVSKNREVETSHAYCDQCFRAMLFAIDRRGGQIACAGVITDCNADEAIRFKNEHKITLDEVLKAHVELRK